MPAASSWTEETAAALRQMAADSSGSYAEIAQKLNAQFSTSYTRNSCVGKAQRMGLCKPQQYGQSVLGIERQRQRDREKKRKLREREKRWAANPSLEAIYQRRGERAETRAMMLSNGNSKTSAVYRRHLPRLPDGMTKSELRAMLAAAVQSTAAIPVPA